MRQIKTTSQFTAWLNRLKDINGRARIQARIQRLASGNPGKHRDLKLGVSELKVMSARAIASITHRRDVLIILLCGGDKSSQTRDIKLAYELVQDLEV